MRRRPHEPRVSVRSSRDGRDTGVPRFPPSHGTRDRNGKIGCLGDQCHGTSEQTPRYHNATAHEPTTRQEGQEAALLRAFDGGVLLERLGAYDQKSFYDPFSYESSSTASVAVHHGRRSRRGRRGNGPLQRAGGARVRAGRDYQARSDDGFRVEVQRLSPKTKGVVRVRVVAEEMDGGVSLPPMGLRELVDATQELLPEVSSAPSLTRRRCRWKQGAAGVVRCRGRCERRRRCWGGTDSFPRRGFSGSDSDRHVREHFGGVRVRFLDGLPEGARSDCDRLGGRHARGRSDM